MAASRDEGPLKGVRVLDFCQFLAGPYATLAMAEMGADVVKVEDHDRLDAARSIGPHFMGQQSVYFASLNWGKRSIAVKLRDPDGYEIIQDLVRNSDVVVDNFSPRVMEKLGLDYNTLSALNPRVICCSLSGYGADGPYADRPAYDYTVQALSGVMSLTGEPDQLPGKAGISYVDHSTGLAAAMAVCAALYERSETGEGRFLDVALLDVQISMLSYLAAWQLNAGAEPTRVAGGAHPTLVPAQLFGTKDGYVSVFVGNDPMWRRLTDAIGESRLLRPEYATNAGRLAHRDEVIGILQGCFSSRSSSELTELLVSRRVPCSPVNSIGEALRDPQVQARDLIGSTSHATYGPYQHVRGPTPTLRRTDTCRAAPLVGQDTRQVLSDIGYTVEQIDSLLDRNVVSANL